MKDPQQAIRDAYLAALQGKVTLNGQPIRVYADFVPSNAPMPYIYLSQQTVADNGTGRTCQSWDTTILVEVLMQTVGDVVKTSDLNTMAAQAVLKLATLPRQTGSFEINQHRLEGSTTLQEAKEGLGVTIHRRLIRFRDLVFETVTT